MPCRPVYIGIPHEHSMLATLDMHQLGHTPELSKGKASFPDPLTSETFS